MPQPHRRAAAAAAPDAARSSLAPLLPPPSRRLAARPARLGRRRREQRLVDDQRRGLGGRRRRRRLAAKGREHATLTRGGGGRRRHRRHAHGGSDRGLAQRERLRDGERVGGEPIDEDARLEPGGGGDDDDRCASHHILDHLLLRVRLGAGLARVAERDHAKQREAREDGEHVVRVVLCQVREPEHPSLAQPDAVDVHHLSQREEEGDPHRHPHQRRPHGGPRPHPVPVHQLLHLEARHFGVVEPGARLLRVARLDPGGVGLELRLDQSHSRRAARLVDLQREQDHAPEQRRQCDRLPPRQPRAVVDRVQQALNGGHGVLEQVAVPCGEVRRRLRRRISEPRARGEDRHRHVAGQRAARQRAARRQHWHRDNLQWAAVCRQR
mmetsp:Transcript_11644/g.38128  ORF Transcript_11644/g.38128 Transcript_11644/m.38128 type:complete len:382 (-) Transcript_11644:149-1294(-)